MPEIWLISNGVQTRIDDKEFEEGVKSGRFTPGDLYWREGMVAWQPVPVALETEPTKDPEALIASMNMWTCWARRVFLAAAICGILAMPGLALIHAEGFRGSDSIISTLLSLYTLLAIIPFLAAGVAIYLIPAVWLYHLCSAAEFCEKPQIPPQFVAIAWCVPLANIIVPVIGLISVAKASASSFPRAAWVIIATTVAGLLLQFVGALGAESAKQSFVLSVFFTFWLLCDAVRYLAWRKIAGDFSHKIELRIRKSMTESEVSVPFRA